MHHHIPICKTCKAELDEHIKNDGGEIIQCLNALRNTDLPSKLSSLSGSTIKHASKLIPYEDLNLKTSEPTPTAIIHRVRTQKYNDLFPKLFVGNDEATASSKHKRTLRNVLVLVAFVVIVVGGGIAGLWQKGGSQPSFPGDSSTKTKVIQPLEAVSPHWRVVIMQSLLKHGPYYNILLYYRGSTPMLSVGHLTVQWNGSTATSEFNGKTIQPGAKVGAFNDEPLRNGFADSPPMQLNWTEQGKKHAETVRLSDATNSLKIENDHSYSGGDTQWKVSYEYETIQGNGFSHSYAMFVVTRKGQPIGNVDCTVNSSAGAQNFSLQSVDSNTTRIDLNLLQPGFDLTGSQVKMTIDWSTGTDVIVLHKSR